MRTFITVNMMLSNTVGFNWNVTMLTVTMRMRVLVIMSVIVRTAVMSSSMLITMQHFHDIQIAAQSKH